MAHANLVATASITVDVSPHPVWRAFTDPRHLSRWWQGMSIDPRVGGSVRETWTEHGHVLQANGEVLAIRSPELIHFRWCEPAWDSPTDVQITIGPHELGSVIAVVEEGFQRLLAGESIAQQHQTGWQTHLNALRDVLARKIVDREEG